MFLFMCRHRQTKQKEVWLVHPTNRDDDDDNHSINLLLINCTFVRVCTCVM